MFEIPRRNINNFIELLEGRTLKITVLNAQNFMNLREFWTYVIAELFFPEVKLKSLTKINHF